MFVFVGLLFACVSWARDGRGGGWLVNLISYERERTREKDEKKRW